MKRIYPESVFPDQRSILFPACKPKYDIAGRNIALKSYLCGANEDQDLKEK